MIVLMLNAVALISQDVNPDLWQRYLDVVLDGIRARPDSRRSAAGAHGRRDGAGGEGLAAASR